MAAPAAGTLPLDRLRAWLLGSGAGGALITDPVSIAYLAGFRAQPHERLFALLVTEKASLLLVPDLERAAAREAAPELEVQGYADGDDPFRLLAAALRGAGSVAVEKDHLSLSRAERLRDRLGQPALLDAGAEVRRLRAVKSRPELQLMEEAARLTDALLENAMAEVGAGRTRAQVEEGVFAFLRSAGAEPAFAALVQSGPETAFPHGAAGPLRAFARGDLILLDLGAAWRGYAGDITRMAVVGEPDGRQEEVHAVVLAAHDAAVAAVRAGITAGEVDAAARAIIEAAGLGERFVHRVGHGLGLEAHEHPSLEPGSRALLEAGMVVTVEPGVYLPGWGGVRIEDEVLVESDGARLLTSSSRRLRALPAS
ncbi:MAG: M24 family metallopeptidase [Candidatus Dormibacterales bacterium]